MSRCWCGAATVGGLRRLPKIMEGEGEEEEEEEGSVAVVRWSGVSSQLCMVAGRSSGDGKSTSDGQGGRLEIGVCFAGGIVRGETPALMNGGRSGFTGEDEVTTVRDGE
ncbi:hypothetical protein HAX54_040499 [Datura stramonium]|uniref:Uncharacterized protein n=1 Tax=Datura stramonium TaxID=4076 RepID=A0ABS8VPN4_DATST|nr:hypothetical protein [Datura stramonium]